MWRSLPQIPHARTATTAASASNGTGSATSEIRTSNGPWYVIADQDGTYEVALRRWPKEADAPISGPVPAFKAVDGGLPPGKALPITRARLKVADVDETKPVGPDDRAVTFTVRLKAGTKMPLQTWFFDADGRELCGAYFTDVRRK